jgi:epsilon-lactone hydrolase
MASEENAALIASMREAPPLTGTTPAEWRKEFDTNFADFPFPASVTRERVALNNDVDGEWFRHGDPNDGAILYAHGGGYMLGSTRSHAALIGNLVVSSGIDALGVNYRLTPEHPFPHGLNDMVMAYEFLLVEGYSPTRIAVAGDSAGGGLGAALLLAIRDRGLPLPACAVLISGWYDLTMSLPSLERNALFDPLLMRDVLEAMASAYVPSDQDRRNPLISPLFSDPTGLPPLLIQVSTHEVLADENALFAQNAQKAGVAATLEMVDEMVHVWHQHAHRVPEAKDAIASAGAFIRKHSGHALLAGSSKGSKA